MRILLDTNVLISALVSHGHCSEVFEDCSQNHTMVSSLILKDEFREKLVEKFSYTKQEAKAATEFMFERIELVEANPASDLKAFADPDDLHVLGAAMAGRCDFILTGDKALLILKAYHDITILPPAAYWQTVGR